MDILPGFKLCRKGLHQYSSDKRQCPACGRASAKSRYHSNPEIKQKIIKASIEYERKNKEKINAKRRERYLTDLEYRKKQKEKRNKNTGSAGFQIRNGGIKKYKKQKNGIEKTKHLRLLMQIEKKQKD